MRKKTLKSKVEVNLHKAETLSKLGWFAFIYYLLSFLLGVCATPFLWILISGDAFKNIVYAVLYSGTWFVLYVISAFMISKILICKKDLNIGLLRLFSCLLFISTFWSGLLFLLTGTGYSGTWDVTLFIIVAYPYINFLGMGFVGVILFSTPPLINLILFLVAWRKPQWLYIK